MTLHLHGNVLTHYGIAANNRGETEGNITTLQKIYWKGDLHSTVSAEAIRFALRYRWQQMFEQTGSEDFRTNRTWNDCEAKFEWKDPSFADRGELYIDDDVLGYMDAKAAANEKEDDQESETKSKKKTAKGSTKARRGPLEVTRAVSLLPFLGETSFGARGGIKDRTSLYATEMHATSYQYGFSVTPAQLRKPDRIRYIVDALVSLGTVGGNHSRFLYDFSPQSVIFRISYDPAPRILYSFESVGHQEVHIGTLFNRVKAGDVRGEELVLAGEVVKSKEASYLADQGANLFKGLIEAAEHIKSLSWM